MFQSFFAGVVYLLLQMNFRKQIRNFATKNEISPSFNTTVPF